MQQKLNAAMSQLSFEKAPMRSNTQTNTSSPRNSRHLDPSTIQAMFPDAAAALAHQRSLLTSNRNSINGLPTGTNGPRSPGLQAAKDAWPSSTETPAKIRPRSADLTGWSGSTTTPQVKSPRVAPQTPSIAEDLTSPFGVSGGSWASMVNTPVVPMFQNPHTTSARGDSDLAGSTAMKFASWTANNRSSVSGGIINLDSDVRKFRRGRSQQTNDNTPTQSGQTNIVMYDEHGHLVQLPAQMASRQFQSPLSTRQSPRPTSPYPPGFNHFQLGVSSPVGLGVGQPYLNPYDSSPVIPPSEFQGYLSDNNSDRRGGSPLGFGATRPKYPINGRRSSSTTKTQEDPLDPGLLNDIPAWLRSLRLHKYTEHLSDVKGGVMALAQLSDQDLERRGVSAVGARRKLLKCFEQVRNGLEAEG
jgi:hypothetical protein